MGIPLQHHLAQGVINLLRYTLSVVKTIVANAYYRHDIVTIKSTVPIIVTTSAGHSQLVITWSLLSPYRPHIAKYDQSATRLLISSRPILS